MKKPFLVGLSAIVYLLSLFVIPSEALAAPGDFITTWRTTTPGETITIPTIGGGYNYDVNWGDSSTSSGVSGDATHVYATAGTYTLTISGTFPRIYFPATGDHPEILSVEQWGDGVWTSMDHAFWGATNLVINATDIPNLSAVTSTEYMFHGTTSLTTVPNINSWDVSNITHMKNMFALSSFNSNIGNWDVSNVIDMTDMFYVNESFNQDIGNWDVSGVTDMHGMFYSASNFNQDIGDWDVSSVTDMGSTLAYAVLFNQDLSTWDISNVTDLTDMFTNTSLSIANYDNILRTWSGLTLQTNVTFGATGRRYCGGYRARADLISNFDWIITDGGLSAATCTFTEAPNLLAPLTNAIHNRNTLLPISFILPEYASPGSIRLTLTPSSGPATVLALRDANPLVTNTFNLPLVGGFASTVEITSYTGPNTLAEGIYTITLAYQDTNGNTAAADVATNVTFADSSGTLLFHIFTDNNGNGTQNVAEINGFTGATLTIIQGSESETVSFDSSGDINSSIDAGTYTLRVNLPTGYTLTGGSNNFSVTITDGLTTNAGSRGVTPSTSGGSGGGSGGGSVVFGGGSSIGSGNSSSNWNSSSSSSRSSSQSSNTSNSTTTSSTTTTDNSLPTPQPQEQACLKSAATSGLNFSDIQNNADVSFISGLTFVSDGTQRLIRGYDSQHFGPNNNLTRFELLKIAMTSNCVGGGNSADFTHTNSRFSDVPKDNSEQSRIIGEAYSRGIITGIGDRFYPNAPVTFAEMTKMIFTSSAYFNQGAPNTVLTVQMSDIPDASFAQPLEYARRLGILPSPFSARSTVSRLQMASLLAKYLRSMSAVVLATS